MKDNLILDIINSDDPENIAKKIDAVFLESTVPYIAKIFQVFKYIYPEDVFNHKMEYHTLSSRYLQSCKTYEKKLGVIYQDLMNIVIKSNESSLRQYINEIISCKKVLYDFEN
ncbi:hypothetical protein J5751_07760 [bacterium]|nr:hypothetical protein [bacterium]